MSLKNKLKRFPSYIVYLLCGLYFICILDAEQDSYISFKNASKYYNFLPDLINSIYEETTPILLTSTYVSSKFLSVDPYKKIMAIKDLYELGVNDGTFIHSLRYRYEDYNEYKEYNDLAIPLVMSIDDYKIEHLYNSFYYAFRGKMVKTVLERVEIVNDTLSPQLELSRASPVRWDVPRREIQRGYIGANQRTLPNEKLF